MRIRPLFDKRVNAARVWFARLRSDRVSPADRANFARWLDANAEHDTQYKRAELAWELSGALQDDPDVEALIADAKSAEAHASVTRSNNKHHKWRITAVAASVAVIAAATLLLARFEREVTYTTPIGELRTVTFPDQSLATLNTATRVRIHYDDSRRVVELETGEATFDVTPDPSRPFEVHANDGIVRALGTRFNVRTSATGVTVSVLSGRVEVVAQSAATSGSGEERTRVLHDGEAVTYSAGKLSEIRPANFTPITAWHAGRVRFVNQPLDEVLREFNRYTAVPLALGDPSLASLRISGSFRAGETQALLRTLEQAFGLRSEQHAHTILLFKSAVREETPP